MSRVVTVAPGAWVSARVPTGTVRASMTIGDSAPAAAYIENIRGRSGGVETYAKQRCPNLRPGRYSVRVVSAGGVGKVDIQVI